MGPDSAQLVFLGKEEIRTQTAPTQRKSVGRLGEKLAIFKPEREGSEETNPGATLILDFDPPEL